jgi:hypothetical protein
MHLGYPYLYNVSISSNLIVDSFKFIFNSSFTGLLPATADIKIGALELLIISYR